MWSAIGAWAGGRKTEDVWRPHAAKDAALTLLGTPEWLSWERVRREGDLIVAAHKVHRCGQGGVARHIKGTLPVEIWSLPGQGRGHVPEAYSSTHAYSSLAASPSQRIRVDVNPAASRA